MQDLLQELRKRIDGEVRFDKLSRILYSTDASIYEIEPIGVVIPKSSDDIQATIESCQKYKVPIIPRGGGTSIVGNAIGSGIVLDCSKYLNKILELNQEEKWVRLQPGVVLDQLNNYLKQHDLFFGPDVATSSRANLGGMIGNNSSGARSVVYGKTLGHVLALDAFLANGEKAHLQSLSQNEWNSRCTKSGFLNSIYSHVHEITKCHEDEIERRFPKIMRRVGGYNLDEFVRADHHNLAKLIVGSEGTLAVVTEAKLNVVALQKHRVLAVVHFEDMFAALDAVAAVLEFGPSAVELLDNHIIDLTRGTMEYSRRLTFVDGFPKALLLVEFQGQSRRAMVDQLEKLTAFLSKKKIGYATFKAIQPDQQANVWYIRKAGLGLLMGMKSPRKPVGFVEDSAVAPERLPEYIRRFDDIVRGNATEAAYYAHASVGCLHIRPKLNLSEQHDIERMAKIADEISSLALEFGGTISGEHGDGIAHSCWNEKMFGRQLYQAFKEIKTAFDPDNILNPGKIVDAPFLTEHLRKPVNRDTLKFKPQLRFQEEGGFAPAIELCNGNGVCRKKDEGTMCPSYMVTMDEADSTRGRANALRAILSGKLDENAFASPELYNIMDLCISCKGCKGECPTNVDMAKIKYEFLHHYHKKNGLPLRDRLFGHIEFLNKIGSFATPVSNWLLQAVPVRWVMQQLLGINCNRKLPPFASVTFEKWFRKRESSVPSTDHRVILFHDTFMNYNYPDVGVAATRLLEAAGYEVLLPEKSCCGRPFISKGMIEQARACARYNIEKLFPLVEEGLPIIGCEPSCMLMFRDEYPELLDDPRVELLAQNSFLIEEFVATKKESLNLSLNSASSPFLLHQHCHMKALVGTEVTRNMLEMIPGSEVEVVDSGCCGMAGSFGYEREHYQISLAMGGRALFKAVEASKDAVQVAAPGVSCRQQIEHGTGVRAQHPVEIVAEHLS